MRNQHHWLLWPGVLAVGPLAIGFIYFATAQHWPVVKKTPNELYAVYILGLTFTVLIVRSAWQRNLLYLLLGGFALTALLREIHYEWTHRGVYLLLLSLIVLAWWWRERLKSLAQTGSFLPWFKGTLVIYLLSVLISRRIFKHLPVTLLPDEELMHVPLEEMLENVAHSMLMITALVGSWSRSPPPMARPH